MRKYVLVAQYKGCLFYSLRCAFSVKKILTFFKLKFIFIKCGLQTAQMLMGGNTVNIVRAGSFNLYKHVGQVINK